MRSHSISAVAILFCSLFLVFYSCQKEPKEKVDNTISSKNPQQLSSSLKVWHGTRTQGTPPAPKGTALQLDNSATDPIFAFAGRYAIIQPEVISGDVSGYYLRVNGASEYFKVDYSKPRNINGRLIRPKHSSTVFARMDSTGGNLDSAIVIVLPSNLQIPDTICVTYWAYDNAGNISNAVSVCIIINSLGADANGAWIDGTWKLTAQWEDNFPHDTVVYNRWVTEEQGGLYCDNGMLQWSDYPIPGKPFLANDSIFYRKVNLTYGSNGGLKYEIDDSWKTIDDANTTCSNIVFNPVENEAESFTGAWSYNSTTHKFVIVFEFDDAGVPVEEAYEFDAVKLNDKSMILIDNTDPSDPYYSRFEKF
jgi:hypothetical protein